MIWFSCSFVFVSRCLVISFGGFGFSRTFWFCFCGFDVYVRLWFWVCMRFAGFWWFCTSLV